MQTAKACVHFFESGGGGGEMDGWMVYCIINGLTITILWVNDDEHD